GIMRPCRNFILHLVLNSAHSYTLAHSRALAADMFCPVFISSIEPWVTTDSWALNRAGPSCGEVLMASVPRYDNDIFISYSHTDNVPLIADSMGWVDFFEDVLRKRIRVRLRMQETEDVKI